MIRKQIIFKPKDKCKLDYNYQHAVQGVIYRLLEQSDKRLANRLHNEGYVYKDGRAFKLFNYTLLFEGVKFSSAIEIDKDSVVKFIISGKRKIVENIIASIVDSQIIKILGLEIKLEGIEDDKKFKFKEVMLYNTLSPVSVSRYDDGTEFLDIFAPEYFNVLGNNLIKKYELIYNEEFTDELYFDIDDFLKAKDKSIKVKDGFVRCKEYDIWIQTTPKMQRIAYYLGLGERSSLGMGCMNHVLGCDADE